MQVTQRQPLLEVPGDILLIAFTAYVIVVWVKVNQRMVAHVKLFENVCSVSAVLIPNDVQPDLVQF